MSESDLAPFVAAVFRDIINNELAEKNESLRAELRAERQSRRHVAIVARDGTVFAEGTLEGATPSDSSSIFPGAIEIDMTMVDGVRPCTLSDLRDLTVRVGGTDLGYNKEMDNAATPLTITDFAIYFDHSGSSYYHLFLSFVTDVLVFEGESSNPAPQDHHPMELDGRRMETAGICFKCGPRIAGRSPVDEDDNIILREDEVEELILEKTLFLPYDGGEEASRSVVFLFDGLDQAGLSESDLAPFVGAISRDVINNELAEENESLRTELRAERQSRRHVAIVARDGTVFAEGTLEGATPSDSSSILPGAIETDMTMVDGVRPCTLSDLEDLTVRIGGTDLGYNKEMNNAATPHIVDYARFFDHSDSSYYRFFLLFITDVTISQAQSSNPAPEDYPMELDGRRMETAGICFKCGPRIAGRSPVDEDDNVNLREDEVEELIFEKTLFLPYDGGDEEASRSVVFLFEGLFDPVFDQAGEE